MSRGLVLSSFSKLMAKKPEVECWEYIARQPSVHGSVSITGLTLARWGSDPGKNEGCPAKPGGEAGSSGGDMAITNNPMNYDGHHPHYFGNVQKSKVMPLNLLKLYGNDRATLAGGRKWLECFDMDCDGPKHVHLHDTDGSLFDQGGGTIAMGKIEHISPEARGANPPFSMFVDMDGNVNEESAVMPNGYGLTREGCGATPLGDGYICPGGSARRRHLMILESLDADTASRRISPVAVLSDGYCDLLRGASFRGYTSGGKWEQLAEPAYVGQFHSTVVDGRRHEIYFASTNPQKLRLRLHRAH
jgi:hypothetical protein